jgi:Spy/CpxP family protein refolding chaperone
VKKTLHIGVVGFLLLSLWAVPAAGQDLEALEALAKRVSGGDGLGKLLPFLLQGIGLTPEQDQRVKEILASHRGTFQALFRQLRAANADLANKLLVPEEIKAQDLAPQVQRITELREQLLLEGLHAVLEMRQVLTPEQRAKAVQLKEHIQALQAAMGGLLGEKSTEATPKKEGPSSPTSGEGTLRKE